MSSITKLHNTYSVAVNDFKNILPKGTNVELWQDLMTLDAVVVAEQVETFQEFQNRWDKFLNSLDQLWNRMNAFAQHHVSDVSKKLSVKGYLDNVNAKRTTDELLVYLDKARNNAHHTIWGHIRQSDNKEVISDAEGLIIEVIGDQLSINTDSGGFLSELVMPFEGSILLKEVEVIENKERKLYFPPESHLGKKLGTTDRFLPLMIGKKGLIFYEKVLDELVKMAA